MTEPRRISCCISGCRRTKRKTENWTDISEWICQRHWHPLDRLMKRRHAKCKRLLNRRLLWWGDPGKLIPIRNRLHDTRTRSWAALKAEAQRLQDTGYWVRLKRRRKSAPSNLKKARITAARFEDQFQRMKRAQAMVARS